MKPNTRNLPRNKNNLAGKVLLNICLGLVILIPSLHIVSGRTETASALPLQTLTLPPIYSTGSVDGYITESSETSTKGGTLNKTSAYIQVGDNSLKKQYRGILSFDTSTLPPDAIITSVTLKLRKYKIVGTDPFSNHGKLLVDIRSGFFGTSQSLQTTDFNATASATGAITIGRTPVSNWYLGKLGSANFKRINRSGVTQFRVRFSIDDDNDSVADYLSVYSGNASLAYRPQLVILYNLPPDTTPPSIITLTAQTGTTEGTVDLSWIAPGDDGDTGTATSYLVKYSNAEITDANWELLYPVECQHRMQQAHRKP
jgi:hypothetical protein